MKVLLQTKILGKGKKPIQAQAGEDLILKEALLLALILPNPNAQGTSPEEALKTRKIFDKIDEAEEEVDLKSEEIVKLKKLVAERLAEIVAGRVIQLLEPDED